MTLACSLSFLDQAIHRVTPVLAVAIMLTGCAAPTGIKYIDAGLASTQRERILVATNREVDGDGDFSGRRSDKLSFADFQVSIPPSHQVGRIEWPKGHPDPARHFAVASKTTLAHGSDYQSVLQRALEKTSKTTAASDAMLFVHGYNTDFSESLYRVAQIQHDFEIKTPITLFSWPSAGKTELYLYDRDSVKASRDKLADVIKLMAQSRAKQLTLVAHSMGTELLMEALRQMAIANDGHLPKAIRAVILIAPDLDIDVFNNQLTAIKTLPRDFAIFVSAKDEALKVSSFLTGDQGRVGNSLDETLIQREGITVLDVSEYSDGDKLNHMAPVTSPDLVALLKGIANKGQKDLFKRQNVDLKQDLSDAIADAATAPIKLVVKGTRRILRQ